MTATSVSSIDVFKYVLAQGINIDLVDEKGKNVVHYLIERTDTNRTTINMMYNELLKHGVNIDQQEKDVLL
jgi:ankyrin repeat protein